MAYGAFTNLMGDHTQVVYSSDWLGRPLWDVAKRHGQSAPVVQLAPKSVWRNPTNYDRTVINVKQHRPAINRFGFEECVGGEMSGTMLIASCSGRWAGFNPSFDSNMRNESQTKCLLKIADNKADLGVGVGTAKQTLNEMSKLASKLFKAYIAAKHGNFRDVFSSLSIRPVDIISGKTLADYWLQWQYGWKPLIVDLRNAYDAVGSAFENYDMLLHSKSGVQFEANNSTSGEYNESHTTTERCLTRIDARVNATRLRAASQLGLVNPLTIAWELTPFSFLLDWAMPIGNVLEATTAHCGLSFAGGSVSQTLWGACTFEKNLAYDSRWLDVGSCTVEKFATQRSVLGDFPVPLPYVKQKTPFSTAHTENALALWRAML